MNLWSTDYTANKGVAEDLTEGKFSFPVIHAIRADPANLQLLNILRQRPTDHAVKRYAVDYMQTMGSFDYCRKVVGEMMERAKKLVEEIDHGEGKGVGVLAILGKFGIDEEKDRL
jgi:geranylgeranyl diphosphate synthase type 3